MTGKDDRQKLEMRSTHRRIVELQADPVKGRFDASHLKEINRRIFQDLPGLGFADVVPGEFRPEVSPGNDWLKTRRLETTNVRSHVAYSRMDGSTLRDLDQVLKAANPEKLSKLDLPDFKEAIGDLYVKLDYIHPFRDGNSRTLREFTRQLAQESGYTLEWEKFGKTPGGRDLLYVARDLSVNALALPGIQHDGTRRDVLMTMDVFEGNKALPELISDVLRPSRAAAFELESREDALKAHPELRAAYVAMDKAQQYIETKYTDSDKKQAAMDVMKKHIQSCLDAGDVAGFMRPRKEKESTLPNKSQPQKTREVER